MDLIAGGSSWFEDQRKAFLSVDAEYRPVNSMFGRPVKATPGMTRWEGMDAAGQVVRLETKAWFISADEVREEPRVGDRISVVEKGRRNVYEAIRPALTDNCWNWSDRNQTLRRIHCHLVSAD